MMKRVLLMFVMLAVVTLVSCNDTRKTQASVSAEPANAAIVPGPRKVALVVKTMTNPFFIEMEKGARNAAHDMGLELQVRAGAQETAVEQQIQIVDELIKENVNAIVIAPSDSRRLIPVLKKAQESGIVIINIDNQLDPEVMKIQHLKLIPFVSVDNEEASYQAAKYIAGQIHKPAKAAIIEGIRSAENARARLQGAKRGFAANANIQIVEEGSANWKIDEARALAKRMFAQHADISILFCANDMMALGALKYLHDSGRKHVLVAGYDALSEARQVILDGTMSVTVDQQAAEQGYQGVALAIKAFNGESVPPVTLVEAHLVIANNSK
jgi:ribose transport system substrate-binding protein